MPRRGAAIYTNYPLPEESNALDDLDDFREEWGNISRADATQRIIIAWSKARRGDPGALAAMGITFSVTSAPPMGSLETPVAPTSEKENKPAMPRRATSGNAKAVELDL